MRVKLSYTVEEDQVLPESAKILGLASDHMQHCIFLYGEVQRKLFRQWYRLKNSPAPDRW